MPRSIPQIESGPAAIGPYSKATEANGFVFVSGQVAFDGATGEPSGRTAADQTRVVMQNITSILADLGLTLADVVKTTIFLSDMNDFATVNEAYGQFVGDEAPARSTVEVARLPRDFLVEIEVIAAR